MRFGNRLGNRHGNRFGSIGTVSVPTSPVGISVGWMPAPRARALRVVAIRLPGALFDERVRAEADGAAVWAVRDARTRQISVKTSKLSSL